MGDSGYIDKPEGKSGLTPVAQSMKQKCTDLSCGFAVMAGDNIYPDGADGVAGSNADVHRFYEAFEKPFGNYSYLGSDFRIYMVLGNHDWRTSRAGAQAQMGYAAKNPPLYMDGPFYKISRSTDEGVIDLFVVDTEMILSEHILDEYDSGDDGIPYKTGDQRSGGKYTAKPISNKERNQLAWLKQELESSTAKWKIVLAHHPLWESNGGKYEELVVLRKILRPIICPNADIYLAGHQHTLEIHEDSCLDVTPERNQPLLHIVSGAAAKARSVSKPFMNWQAKTHTQMKTHFALGDEWGYMILNLQGGRQIINIYSMPTGSGYLQDARLVEQLIFD